MSEVTLFPRARAEQPWLTDSGEVTAEVSDGTETRAVSRTVHLYGPGHVRGLRREVVLERFPAPNARSVPLDYFPHILLRPADLPWRYSARTSDQPWLMLIACAADEVRVSHSRGLATLIWKGQPSLPDPAGAGKWAHAQGPLETPELARIIAPVRLPANSSVLVALVPTTEAGRRAALGELPEDPDSMAPWVAGPGLCLPAFDVWRFQTGSTTLEEVAGKIKPHTDPTLGTRDLQVHWPDGQSTAAQYAGALVGSVPELQQESAEHLGAAPVSPTAEDWGPPAGPIAWGAPWRALADKLELLQHTPTLRAAAGLGRAVVVENQEELVASAWDQLAEVRRVNQALRQAELAEHAVLGPLRRRILEAPYAAAGRLGLRTLGRLPTQDGGTAFTAWSKGDMPYGVEEPALVRRVLRSGSAARRRAGPQGLGTLGKAATVAVLGQRGNTTLNTLGAELNPVLDLLGFDETRNTTLNTLGAELKAWCCQPGSGPWSRVCSRVLGGPEGEDRDRLLRTRRWRLDLDFALAPALVRLRGAEPLVPGLEGLPNDRALLLNVHAPWIEALMVGANQALVDELLWRGFPAGAEDTPLRRFWSSSPDIGPIQRWDKALGEHLSSKATTALVLRSPLLGMLPGLSLRLVRRQGDTLEWEEARWTCGLGSDTVAAGLPRSGEELRAEGWHIVLEEPAGALRFGVDAEQALPEHALESVQQPLRVVFRATSLLPEPLVNPTPDPEGA